ncbi:hypothetical protein predicted by Glimmer/Critica [Sorangium cellulosum So ce56]|uniref:Uncharacterized protein n=1 Tax=Sorangium cellulosum (strain So ce56) TaxID=448385 RepID=A9EVT4_SORC5|nr:hypothetical protein [Sorangium cellulosum]CAN94255.1 hypothetical protein predicted by Glimmer/Critica [Sorangium cellulosum So ce56]
MTAAWRQHPRLEGRFHVDHPDDLQVLVHEGGPRLTDRRPELVWVRVTACHGDVFTARVLNQPHQLKTVNEGAEVRFIAPTGGEHLLQVREQYLRERADWVIGPCSRCGLDELFDAPSELIAKVFPNVPASARMDAFSAFCGACGGVQLVQHKDFRQDEGEGPDEQTEQQSPGKKWWQFWK